MSVTDVRELPIAMFWMLSKNIDRLMAEEDYRLAVVTTSVQTQEGIDDLFPRLKSQIGVIVDYDQDEIGPDKPISEERDREGLMEIATMNRIYG